MQHHAPFGYPTPPASPAYDNVKCNIPQPYATRQFVSPPRCIPLPAEQRLGRLLEGRLQLTEILGTGAYGVVYSAIDINTGARYAVKCLSKYNSDGSPLERRQVAYQNREIRLHYLASAHSNVVSILKIVEDIDCIYVILEYCPEGDLFQNITEHGHYVGKDELARNVFLQILDAVEHCHKLGIYHRDLKPENILVTDQGETVKLADFGLATADDRSEDYGCGSTFYMSPECLDPSARKPYYMCAPNDVWSLGVILVNLTCGRNPWKQASFQDSTYRAYEASRDFLKTILPVTDELNDILARIFNPSPEHRITLSELRERIKACPRLTVPPPVSTFSVPPTPVSHEHMNDYLIPEEAIMDDSDCESPLSPASTYSDEGSLTSSGSTIDDLDDDFVNEQQNVDFGSPTQMYDQDMTAEAAMFHAQEFIPQKYAAPVPVAVTPVPPHQQLPSQTLHCPPPLHVQAPVPVQQCQPKAYFPFWEMVKYVQQVPLMQHPVSFHHQAPVMPSFQGCF